MIKNKIRFCLLTSLLSLQLSFPSFAMQEDDDVQTIRSAAGRVQKKIETLIQERDIINNSLAGADALINLLLDPQTPPTTHSFLSAVYHQKPVDELQRLWTLATNRQEIANIIIGGTQKFRRDAPDAHVKVLEITRLLGHIRISADYATVRYGDLIIEPTLPQRAATSMQQASESRRRSLGGIPIGAQQQQFVEEARREKIEETQAIQAVIQANAKDLGIPIKN